MLIALCSRSGSAPMLSMGIFGFAMVVLGVTWWCEVRPLTLSLPAHAGDCDGAGRAGRTLEWWANISVAIGLLFTFPASWRR